MHGGYESPVLALLKKLTFKRHLLIFSLVFFLLPFVFGFTSALNINKQCICKNKNGFVGIPWVQFLVRSMIYLVTAPWQVGFTGTNKIIKIKQLLACLLLRWVPTQMKIMPNNSLPASFGLGRQRRRHWALQIIIPYASLKNYRSLVHLIY
jgi:hypothetical protein